MKTMFLVVASTAFVMTGGGCAPNSGDQPSEDALIIFHNGTGSGCLAALEWLGTMQSEHPDLVVEEYLTTEFASFLLLNQMKTLYGQSQGVSTTFGYLPIIFYRGQAFSGFNDEVRSALTVLIEATEAPAS